MRVRSALLSFLTQLAALWSGSPRLDRFVVSARVVADGAAGLEWWSCLLAVVAPSPRRMYASDVSTRSRQLHNPIEVIKKGLDPALLHYAPWLAANEEFVSTASTGVGCRLCRRLRLA